VTTSQGTLQQLIGDATVDGSMEAVAEMFGLPKETVRTIVRVGLPLMARMARANPEIFKRMHAAALATMPEPMPDLYARMATSLPVRQAAMDDYRATYGQTLDAVNRAAAVRAGTTDGQAREALAAMLPALSLALGSAAGGLDRAAFAKALRSRGGNDEHATG
jgi:hypothetical protein